MISKSIAELTKLKHKPKIQLNFTKDSNAIIYVWTLLFDQKKEAIIKQWCLYQHIKDFSRAVTGFDIVAKNKSDILYCFIKKGIKIFLNRNLIKTDVLYLFDNDLDVSLYLLE